MLRRKTLYETLHPETKGGATGGGGKDRVTKADLSDSDKPADRFTLDTAKNLGIAEGIDVN